MSSWTTAEIRAALETHRGNVRLAAMEVLAAVKRTASAADSTDTNPKDLKTPRPDEQEPEPPESQTTDIDAQEPEPLELYTAEITEVPLTIDPSTKELLLGSFDDPRDSTHLSGWSYDNHPSFDNLIDTSNLSNLTTLRWKWGELYRIPTFVLQLTGLTTLKLTYNKLENLDGIGALTQLKSLTVRHTNLEVLPDDIGTLSSLTHLDVSNNEIKSLPASIGNLNNLQILKASDNKLTTVPKEIGYLTQITKLIIRINPLTHLPFNITRLAYFMPDPDDNPDVELSLFPVSRQDANTDSGLIEDEMGYPMWFPPKTLMITYPTSTTMGGPETITVDVPGGIRDVFNPEPMGELQEALAEQWKRMADLRGKLYVALGSSAEVMPRQERYEAVLRLTPPPNIYWNDEFWTWDEEEEY
jgi:Leucine-rich repeat (LRR) protein